jgi:glutamate/tyrosine decarboxylase-like PLP-dependent enzyme
VQGVNARKFARYFDVEARIIPVSKESNYCLDVSKIRENLDENTIGTPPLSFAGVDCRDLRDSWIDVHWTL